MSIFQTSVLQRLSNTKFLSIAGLSLVTVAVVISLNTNTTPSTATKSIELSPKKAAPQVVVDTLKPETIIKTVPLPPQFEYTIKKGDTLSGVFSKLNISREDMQKVMESDLDSLKIDTLKPGDTLRFWLDENNHKLTKFELQQTPAQKFDYVRTPSGDFEYQETTLPGQWKSAVASGTIHGSFSVSAQKAGLDYSEVLEITNLLKDKLNFARDLRAGDTFEVVHERQFIDGKPTGQHEVRAIRIHNKGKIISAYLHTDGNYYDEDGNSLQRAFLRYPSAKQWRISSNFNPNRKHPVTGRRQPHNGVDFAAPRGTPVLATGDGVVVLTTNHPYAGRYIVIQHGTNYKTRYLHNTKILVKKGQRVHRGQEIALSGSTGRVTGPHIHYEFLIRNKPVNPMTANIPMASSVPGKEKKVFEQMVAQYNQMMKDPMSAETIQLARIKPKTKDS
ncbi:peptidase M23 [Photobacterium damselae subsp. damselae]|uniref:peptidoglycan DD-metalloendopeptidase family protein n=1 Tax=Photobacterium damselae TaxID=38293 RepID=UPI000D05236B|nr:peptidoglycan DD-metalloendopeptidase family protein [Photobacterium damselae]PSB89918.1 peptidase M23 [Photobacterium damselae subsp. damselae]